MILGLDKSPLDKCPTTEFSFARHFFSVKVCNKSIENTLFWLVLKHKHFFLNKEVNFNNDVPRAYAVSDVDPDP